MAYLFTIENNIAMPKPEVLLTSPFKEIWERDKTQKKSRALKEFTFIEFTTSMKSSNPYAGYDESVREIKVKEEVMGDIKWKPDKLIKAALKKVEDYQTEASPAYTFYMSAKKATEALKRFFNEVDLHEVNEKGYPIYKPKDITSALNDTEKIIVNLANLKKRLGDEIEEASKVRGGKAISYFADPNNR